MLVEGRHWLTYTFIRPTPFCITAGELRQMKSAVWLPPAGWTTGHLLWVSNLSSSQCAVTPISEQLLDAIHTSIVMAYAVMRKPARLKS